MGTLDREGRAPRGRRGNHGWHGSDGFDEDGPEYDNRMGANEWGHRTGRAALRAAVG